MLNHTHRIDPSGTSVAYVNGKTIYLSPLNDLEKSQPVGRHDEPIWSVAFHSDGSRLASVDISGQIRVWSSTGELLRRIDTKDENLRGVRFDTTGSKLVTQFNTSGISAIWDLNGPPNAEVQFLYRRSGGWLMGADFDPSGRWVVTGRYGAVAYPLGRSYPRIFRGHRGWIRGLVFDPDGSWIASSSMEGDLIQWPLSPEAGTHYRILLDEERLFELAVDPKGRFLVAGTASNPLIVDLKSGFSKELDINLEIAEVVAVGPEGRRIAAVSGWVGHPSVIKVLDLETGNVQALDATDQDTVRLRFTSNGRLISSNRNGDVRSWDVNEGTYELLLERSADWFDITPDERTLVGLFNDKATVFDLEDGSRRELLSHGDRLGELALDPTGSLVVTGDKDGVIRVGPVSGEEPHLLLGHQGAVHWLKVSPKGDWIASGGGDHTVRLWPMPDIDKPPFHTLPYDELLSRLKKLTNLRAVTDEESPTGYRISIDPFPGWEKVPEW